MTLTSLQKQADNVRHSVTSQKTCSTSTVANLEQLLFQTRAPDAEELKCHAPVALQVTTAVKRKPKPGTTLKTRVRTKVLVVETRQAEELYLDQSEKFCLATEVFNISLKALTEATKSTSKNRRLSSSKDVRSVSRCTLGSKVDRPISPVPKQPLQPRSVNRVSCSPSTSPLLQRSSACPLTAPHAGLRSVAECARLSIKALRLLDTHGIRREDAPILQLETGMSALIGRLIALSLNDLAFKELCILKKRLELPRGSTNQVKIKGEEMGQETETLPGLLRFERTDAEGPALMLMIQVQMHALKLVQSRKQPSIIESTVHSMQLSVSGSPIDLILKASSRGPPSSAKNIAKQIDLLAQILMSFCPSISSSEDVNLEHTEAALSPGTVFEAQALAFDMRIQSWRLSFNEPDVERDLYGPFARCLTAYNRRSSESALVKYKLVVEKFDRFLVGVEDTLRLRKASSSTESSLIRLYKLMGALAQESLLIEEAIEWETRSLLLLRDGSVSAALNGACVCKIALLQLQLATKTGNVEGLKQGVENSIRSLEGPLRGDSAELDELMTVVASLRKAAMAYIARSSPTSSEDCAMDEVSSNGGIACSQLIHACLKFFVRYIGTAPLLEGGPKSLTRYEQRRSLSFAAARSAIESVIVTTKLSLGTNDISWETSDSILLECASLLSKLEAEFISPHEPPIQPAAAKQLMFVKLSNVYWSYYLKQKQTSCPPPELMVSLRRSVEMIKNRTAIERDAGFLAVKLERLAVLQENSRRFKDAQELYAEAVQSHIDLGVLCKVSSAARERSLLDVLEGDGVNGIFGRALSSWTRLAVKSSSSLQYPLDDEALPLDERGTLLEWQLVVVSNLLEARSMTDKQRRTVTLLANLLLSIYQPDSFPIRRLRLILRLFRIESTHTETPDVTLMEELLEELNDQSWQMSVANDEGLAKYELHLKACLSTIVALRKACTSTESLQFALRRWYNVLDACKTWDGLSVMVEDRRDWLSQLQSITDFLEMQGHEMLRVQALHLLARVKEIQIPLDHSSLVRTLTDLGLQYSRLGYSVKAGQAFARAARHVGSDDVSTETKVRWYLANAEYLKEIGNLDKWYVCIQIISLMQG